MRLNEAFFARDVLCVAPELVGKALVRRLPDGVCLRARITQTEAYRGQEDGACHARSGRTARNAVMYARGGHAYVYLIYGLHWLFNVVTGAQGEPQAALIRALEAPLDGPAKWTRAFGVTGEQNGLWLPENDALWLEDDGYAPPIARAARVGIDYAPPVWRDKPWRFIDASKEA